MWFKSSQFTAGPADQVHHDERTSLSSNVLHTLVLASLCACDDPTQPRAVAPPATSVASTVDQQFRVRFLPRGFALPEAINEAGEAVGIKDLPTGNFHAALWKAGQGVRDLGTLDGPFSQAIDINDRSDVVGASCTRPACDELRPFLWSDARGMRGLGTFGGQLSAASAINNRREVVGGSQKIDGTSRAFLWRPRRGLSNLGTLGGPNSFATDVNDATQVIGSSQTNDGSEHAFLWTAERGMEDLGTLGGANSVALGISETGVVVGRSETATGTTEAFLWTRSRGMRGLGTLGEPVSDALSINTHRRVVGYTMTESFRQLPFLWTPEGSMQRLPMLDNDFGYAVDLNEFGQILGQLGREGRAALWTPTPGPLATEAPDEDAEFQVNASPEKAREARAAWCALERKLRGWSRMAAAGSKVCGVR